MDNGFNTCVCRRPRSRDCGEIVDHENAAAVLLGGVLNHSNCDDRVKDPYLCQQVVQADNWIIVVGMAKSCPWEKLCLSTVASMSVPRH